MSRVGSNRRSPADLIWGWGTNGDRHPGILERLEIVEHTMRRQSRVLYVVLAAVMIDVASNSSGHLIPLLRASAQALGALLPYIQ